MDAAEAKTYCLNCNIVMPKQSLPRGSHQSGSTLDYLIAANQEIEAEEATSISTAGITTDHLPITTTIALEHNPTTKSAKRKKWVLKKDLTEGQYLQILEDPDWPKKPFIRVAAKKHLARKTNADESTMERLVGNLDRIEELATRIKTGLEMTRRERKLDIVTADRTKF